MEQKRAERSPVLRWVLLALLAAVLTAVVIYAVKTVRLVNQTREMVEVMQETGTVGKIETPEVQTPPEYQGTYINLLVVGIDYDAGDEQRDYGSPEDANTDVILYLHYNIKENNVSILQIPRDSYVGFTANKRINRVFAEGSSQDNHIQNLAEYIHDAFGLSVDKYVALDMGAFKEIVDVMGGMDLYVPFDIYEYDEAGNEYLSVPAGTVRMNGADVERVVRARKQFQQADLQRLVLQRYVYAAMFKLIKSCTMGDLYRHVLPIVAYRIKTDLDFDDLYALSVNGLKLSGDRIFFVRVPGGPLTIDGEAVYGVDAAALAPILNEHFLLEGEPLIDAADMQIPTGWDYPLGEVIEEGSYLSDQLAEADADANAADEAE